MHEISIYFQSVACFISLCRQSFFFFFGNAVKVGVVSQFLGHKSFGKIIVKLQWDITQDVNYFRGEKIRYSILNHFDGHPS